MNSNPGIWKGVLSNKLQIRETNTANKDALRTKLLKNVISSEQHKTARLDLQNKVLKLSGFRSTRNVHVNEIKRGNFMIPRNSIQHIHRKTPYREVKNSMQAIHSDHPYSEICNYKASFIVEAEETNNILKIGHKYNCNIKVQLDSLPSNDIIKNSFYLLITSNKEDLLEGDSLIKLKFNTNLVGVVSFPFVPQDNSFNIKIDMYQSISHVFCKNLELSAV